MIHNKKIYSNQKVFKSESISFFTPILPTNTNLPLDGAARNDLVSTWISNVTKFVVPGSFFSYLLIPKDRKKPFGLSLN